MTRASVTDLAEYRDQLDQGNPAAVAMLFDGLGPDPRPLTLDEANFIAGELQDLLQGAVSIVRATKGREPAALHEWAEVKVAEIESWQRRLAGLDGAA